MTTAGKFSLQPSISNHLSQAHTGGALAHAEHVGIIMLAAHFCRENIGAQSSADALAFIGGNGNADAGAANQNTTLSTALTTSDILAELFSKIRIINTILIIGAVVDDFDTLVS